MFLIKKTSPLSLVNTFFLQNKLFSSAINAMDNPIVSVSQGKLKGARKKLCDGSPYYSFKGIPYGQPPVNELRFKAPLPAKPWDGARDALYHGAVCPQFDIYTSSFTEGNEDCLFLNVYTKSLEASSKLPVMVYIHGGAFMSGHGNSESYGPQYLCQKDVILVTFNHRLEVLGFLCLDTPDVPGNAGMKDQVLALRWVKENIEKFGGDPNNVTLFGESAGAAAVNYHMFSPMSEGLFHKAIAQSGNCIQDWAIGTSPRERAFRVGKILGKDTDNPTDLANYLRTLPATKLMKLTFHTMTDDEKFRGLPIHFNPVIEQKFDNIETFLTEDPIKLLLRQKVAKVPFIMGYNSGEGFLPLAAVMKKVDLLNKEPSYLLPKEIAQKVTADKLAEMGTRLKKFYLGDKDISEETSQEVADMETDREFAYNCHRFIHLYSSFNEPTYMYKFDLSSDMNILKKRLGFEGLKGVCHGDELFYLFDTPITRDIYEGQEEARHAVHKVTKLWTDFAKTGVAAWPPYSRAGACLHIAGDVTSCARADRHRIDFWNKLYAEAGLPCIVESSA